jgi:hypothetical protein
MGVWQSLGGSIGDLGRQTGSIKDHPSHLADFADSVKELLHGRGIEEAGRHDPDLGICL